ncbi:hypothetical protein M413DRAFT_23662 [Hebeloma cylindrosporum]|uniref:Uncharacterized protein n=1 Tax=Hebeloma cylindrosporum TaxID=76867 RepID=A0A0C3CP29_HEBCY|nr:hypothetical protein M413DRAFT_23662 [Hebeloma cylindrosporum h7]
MPDPPELGVSLGSLMHGFESSDVDVALTFDHANADEMDVNSSVKPAVLLKKIVTGASLLESSDDGGPQARPPSLDSDPPSGRALHADISYTPDIKAPNSQNNSYLSHTLSSNLRSSSTSDILSRSTESGLAISAGYCSDALPVPALDVPNCPAEYSEPDPLTDTSYLTIDSGEVSSFTSGERSEESHEETAMTFATDAHAEYSQSSPYITPATAFRAHIQGLPSSSPPSSSPPMNLDFMSSSSPMPSSSPLDGMARTPPTSPPAATDADERGMPGAGQEVLDAGEIYPLCSQQFEHVLCDTQIQSQPPAVSDLNLLYYPPTVSASMLAPNFYNHVPEPSHNMEQYARERLQFQTIAEYPQENACFIPLPSPQPTTSIWIPPAQQTDIDNDKIEPLADKAQAHRTAPRTVIPAPKRSTVAGQRAQQKKLTRPFRSPVMQRLAPKPSAGPSTSFMSSDTVVLNEVTAVPPTAKIVEESGNAVAPASSHTLDTNIKHRTTRAASQFKSPLTTTSTASADEAALVRLTPTIQSLERKLQLLRRALKVRENLQEVVLGGLVKKWTEAGREVAWEVWDNVKDNASSEGRGNLMKGKKRAIEESWGWDESGGSKKPKEDRNWGWDVVPVSDRGTESEQVGETVVGSLEREEEADEEDVPHATVGTMLIQLGIAPQTLGWDEEEGTFVDK